MPWTHIPQDTAVNLYPDGVVAAQRPLSYAAALYEALAQAMRMNPSVFVMGQGVDDPSGMFGATTGLQAEFGAHRVFDTPLSENALTGVAIGAAQAGMRPVYMHNRPDFLFLALDQLANHAAKWAFMFQGKVRVPLVVWACTGRGWGSAAQHSQALHGLFMHIPGLKIVLPASPYEVKGLMLSALRDDNPVLILDHRYNFRLNEHVPEHPYFIPLGKGVVLRTGRDITLVALSHLVQESCQAAEVLSHEGISVEVLNLRCLCPLDTDILLYSLEKTGRLLIADPACEHGAAAALAAMVAEKAFHLLRAPIMRVTQPHLPTPATPELETAYYIHRDHIVEAARALVRTQKYPNKAE